MTIKEVGFRPVYRFVSAFKINDMLKKLVKDCPEAEKSSHAVFYGYIDNDVFFSEYAGENAFKVLR